MPINRYYYADPGVTGPIEFFAGWGQRRQQVQDQENAWQGEANKALGQGIGQGIGNFFNTIATDMTQGRASQRQLQNALTLQRDEQAGRLAVAQEKYGVPPGYTEAMKIVYGLDNGGQQGGMPTQGMSGGAVPGEYGVSLPDQGISQTFPQQAPQPLSGEQLRMGRDAELKAASIRRSLQAAIAQAESPREKLAIAQAGRDLPRLDETARMYRPQKPPTTEAELIAAGPNGGGFAVLSDGTRFSVDGAGKQHYDKPAKTSHADELLTWRTNPDPVQREAGRQQYMRDSFGGDDATWQAFKARGGYGEIDLTTGKVNWTEPKNESPQGFKWDENKEYEEARDSIEKRHKGDESPYVATPREIAEEMNSKRKTLAQRTPAHQADVRVQFLRKSLSELVTMYPGGPDTMPANHRFTYAQWKREYEALAGK